VRAPLSAHELTDVVRKGTGAGGMPSMALCALRSVMKVSAMADIPVPSPPFSSTTTPTGQLPAAKLGSVTLVP
jgi:hypothetical protein